MLSENQPPAINWDWILFKKLADVEDAAKEFEEKIPEQFKADFKKEPENIRTFVVVLSLFSEKERQELEKDLGSGKAKSMLLTAHDLGTCLMLYKIFSGEALLKKGEII